MSTERSTERPAERRPTEWQPAGQLARHFDGGRGGFEDDADGVHTVPLTHEEAQALRARSPSVSPWRVVVVQAAVGVTVAALAWWVGGTAVAASALYGAGVAVVPGALMARGMTSRLSSLSPVASTVSVMFWMLVKLGVAVLMLLLAVRIVQPLSWPALLIALVLCTQVYWFALLWRGRSGRIGTGHERHGS